MEKDRYDLYAESKKSKTSKIINVLFSIGLIIGIILVGMYFFEGCETQSEEKNIPNNDVNETEINNDSETTEDGFIEVEAMEITKEPLERINFKKVGTIEPYKSAIVTSQTSGNITDFQFDEGDKVEKNELIAQISDSIAVAGAQINFETTQKLLENSLKSLSGTKNSVAQDIQMSQIGVSNAEINLQNSIDSYNNAINAWEQQLRATMLAVQGAEIGFNSAQEKYYDSLESSSTTLGNTINQSLSSIISSLTLIDSATNNVDSFLTYENELSEVLSQSGLNDIKNDNRNLKGEYENLLSDYYDTEDNEDSGDAINLIEDTLNTLEDSQFLLLDVKEAINDAIDSDSESITAIYTLLSTTQTGINSMLVTIDQSRNGLLMAKQGLDSAVLNGQFQPEGTFTGLEASETQLQSAKQAYAIANANKESQLDALRNSVDLSRNQVSTAKAQLASMQAKANLQVIGAESQLVQVKSQADLAEVNLGSSIIKSPIAGILLDKFVEEGNFVNPSQKVIRVGDMSKVNVIVSLTSKELGFIKLGQNVKITAPGGILTTGKVSKVTAALDPVTKKLDVKIVIPNADGKFVAGMFADVSFIEAQKDAAGIFVPFKSIIFESEGEYVYIVENHKAVKKAVKLGQISGNQIEIIDGISLKDSVITKGSKLVKEGDLVEVVSA